jgi:D-glycero-alpha-D-manno-heptose-7-phosphate kinase
MTTISHPAPIRTVNSAAPIRICDLGGWTDTWFAAHGQVLNIGVYPYVEVQIDVYRREDLDEHVVIEAENYGDRYAIAPSSDLWTRHPLIEAAIHFMQVPDHLSLVVNIYSDAPAGASTGTSSAVLVALIAALNRICERGLDVQGIGEAAYHVEYHILGLQCGVQDQFCSAYGGVSFIEIDDFPNAVVHKLDLPNDIWWELESRLLLVYLGKSHKSSDVHRRVIASQERTAGRSRAMRHLRDIAATGRDALLRGDLTAFGAAMTANSDAQRELHEGLISMDARHIIEIAGAFKASGWKVNGAGGEGGTITILCDPSARQKRELISAIRDAHEGYRIIPTYLSRFGVRVWETRR